MALDEDATDVAYLLGRLFGAYAYAETSYQARGAGLRQKYHGRGLGHARAGLSGADARLRAQPVEPAKGRRDEGRVRGQGRPGRHGHYRGLEGDMPAALPLEDQGRFFIGFYHQIAAFYAKAEDAADALIEREENTHDRAGEDGTER